MVAVYCYYAVSTTVMDIAIQIKMKLPVTTHKPIQADNLLFASLYTPCLILCFAYRKYKVHLCVFYTSIDGIDLEVTQGKIIFLSLSLEKKFKSMYNEHYQFGSKVKNKLIQ